MSSLFIAEAVILWLVVPLVVWMTTGDRRHVNRAGAWSMAATSGVMILRHLPLIFAPPAPPTELVLLVRALTLAGWGVCCGSLVGWLYRTRDRVEQAS